MKLSVVVPAHNEEDRIRPMLDKYIAFFVERYGDDVEMIVVVNGSTDTTGQRQEVKRLGATVDAIKWSTTTISIQWTYDK